MNTTYQPQILQDLGTFIIDRILFKLCFYDNNQKNNFESSFCKGQRLSRLPPRSLCIEPRTMNNVPKAEDEEWKRIGYKRIKIPERDIGCVINPQNMATVDIQKIKTSNIFSKYIVFIKIQSQIHKDWIEKYRIEE